ncbi:MAG: hypothetical protein AAF871_15095 [Pseudomonadota bacterium]
MSRLSVLTAAIALCFVNGASAQSSLGVTGVEIGAGGVSGRDGGTSFSADLTIDVAVTEYHGLQGDLAWINTGSEDLGRLAGHLYMVPRPGHKYGLYAALGDVNDRSLTYGVAGIEGMFEVNDRSALGGFLGLGMGSEDGLDVIFGGLEGTYRFSSAIRFDGGVQVTEYDEIALQAIGTELDVNMRYAPEGQPFAVTLGVGHSLLTGPDGEPGETRAKLGLSWRFGEINGAAPNTRPFRTPDPFLPLIRRGLY